jgi:predicted O-methyltransferase YrrM
MENLNYFTEPAQIPALWADTQAAGFTMATDSLTCSLLRTLAASKISARFLELGSGTGVSTAWLLDGMDANSRLITVDNDASLLAILKRHLGQDPRLEIVCADGDEFLQSLKGQHFDFIFADTWPGKYRLLEQTLALLNPGGLYVIDDMLPQPNWPEGHTDKVTALLNQLEHMPGFQISKLSWASGIVIVTKYESAKTYVSED